MKPFDWLREYKFLWDKEGGFGVLEGKRYYFHYTENTYHNNTLEYLIYFMCVCVLILVTVNVGYRTDNDALIRLTTEMYRNIKKFMVQGGDPTGINTYIST